MTATGIPLLMQRLGGIILKKGRKLRVRKLSMLLHPGSRYRVKDGYVENIGGLNPGSLAGTGDMMITRMERLG